MTNGSAHLLHRPRSASLTSVLANCASSVRKLAPALLSVSVATSPFTGAPCPRHSSQKSIPFLRMPSEHIEHLETGVVCVSQMAHLPFRVCIWHCAPHIGHVSSLSGGPGFFRLTNSAFCRHSPTSIFCPSTFLGSASAIGVELGVLRPAGLSHPSVGSKSVADHLDESAPELVVDVRPLLAKVVLQSFLQLFCCGALASLQGCSSTLRALSNCSVLCLSHSFSQHCFLRDL